MPKKQDYLEILGEMPEKTSFNAKITATYDMGDFVMENVRYESSSNCHVTATLYRPKGAGKYPAVAILCGHGAMGKNLPGEQRAALSMPPTG